MPEYWLTFHTGFSDEGINWIHTNFSANIVHEERGQDFYRLRINVASLTVAQNAKDTIMNNLIRVTEILGT